MEQDDEQRRKGISHSQPLQRDAVAAAAFARHAVLSSCSADDDPIASASACFVSYSRAGSLSRGSGEEAALEERALPEFVGAGGGEVRCAPSCEPRLNQLWAEAESGVRVWGLDEVFYGAPRTTARRGDEESAPFFESVPTPPALCVVVDLPARWHPEKRKKKGEKSVRMKICRGLNA